MLLDAKNSAQCIVNTQTIPRRELRIVKQLLLVLSKHVNPVSRMMELK